MDSKIKKVLLQKYLKADVLRKRGAWPREMKIFNSLCDIYTNEEFWNWYKPNFQLNSLAWFLGDGKQVIFNANESFLFDKASKSNIITDSNINKSISQGEPIPPPIIKSRPTTISSWLRK